MRTLLYRIILFGCDINGLKKFYVNHFGCSLVEEIEAEWVVLKAGSIELALHKIGKDYRNKTTKSLKFENNIKLVFRIEQDLSEFRQKLLDEGVKMQEVKSFEGFNSLFCDGEDMEGNIFQLEQHLH